MYLDYFWSKLFYSSFIESFLGGEMSCDRKTFCFQKVCNILALVRAGNHSHARVGGRDNSALRRASMCFLSSMSRNLHCSLWDRLGLLENSDLIFWEDFSKYVDFWFNQIIQYSIPPSYLHQKRQYLDLQI